MQENKEQVKYVFPLSSISTILFIVFLMLKLTGVVAWSWVLVCLPLIISGGLMVLGLILMLLTILMCLIINKIE